MVAIFTGAGTGFERGSGALLGSGGTMGGAAMGRSGEQVMLNAANGNLIVSQRDEFLVGRGPDAAILRTYNSRGDRTDDNGDNWRMGNQRRVHGLTGTLNAAGSTVKRTAADGSVVTFTWDGGANAYVSTEGTGAHDRLRYDQMWRWTDGDSQTVESYGGPDQQISEIADSSGNRISFTYENGRLLRMQTADGVTGSRGTIEYRWNAGTNNIGSTVTTYIDPATGLSRSSTRTRYGYDSLNRLQTVEVDLSPDDDLTVDGDTYVTTYSYHGSSQYIASIAQSDGSLLSLTYDASGRVERMAQAVAGTSERVTTIAYENGATTVTDPAGQHTRFDYNADGSLRTLTAPPAVSGAAQQVTRFTYTMNGDVDSVTDAAGRVTRHAYDLNGNNVMTLEPDGGVIVRTYNADNQLLTEARDANRVHNAAVSFSSEGWGYPYNPNNIVSGPITTGTAGGKNFIRGHYRATAAGQVLSIGSAPFAVQGGEWLYVGTGLEAPAPIGSMTLVVWWTDASGQGVGSTAIATVHGAQPYDSKVAKAFEVPAGAATGRLELYGSPSGAGDGHILMVEPTVVRVAAGRTEAPGFGDYADGAGPSVTRYVYDSAKRLAYVIDGEGGVTQRRYDAAGQVEWTVAYTQQQFYLPMLGWNGVPSMTQMADWLNGQDRSAAMVTGYRYDAQGNVIEQIGYGGTNGDGFVNLNDGYSSTSFQYDRAGQLIGRTQRRGSLQADQEGRLGRFLRETGVRGGTGPTLSKTYVLNPAAGRTTIDADLIKLDTWDGEKLRVHLNGAVAFSFVPASFNTSQDNWSGQISVGGITGTWTIVSSGKDGYLAGLGNYGDRVYRMHLDLRGTGQAVVFGLSSTLDEGRDNESFGIDNVVVAQDAAFDDFETGTAGWMLNGQPAPLLATQRTDQGGIGAAIGPIGSTGGSEALTKTYSLNPAQPRTNVDFEFMRLDSWDDETLSVFLNGNRAFDVQLRMFTDAPTRNGSFTFGGLRGSYRVTPLGAERQIVGSTVYPDQKYRVEIELEGAGGSLRVGFGAAFDEPAHNESFAIDSVRVGQPAIVDTFQTSDLAGWSASSGTPTIEGSGSGDPSALPAQERFVYDGLGRLIASTDAQGATTRIVFDDRNARTIMAIGTGLTTVSTYNRAGELIASSRSGSAMVNGAERFVYDPLGRPRMRVDALGNASYWLYDDAGRKVADIAHGGQITEYRYNPAGQLTATVQHGAAVTRAWLDTLAGGGRVDIAQIRPAAHADDLATWNVYDGKGRLTGRADSAGSVVEYGYTINDQVAWTRQYRNRLDAGTIGAFFGNPPAGLVRPVPSDQDAVARNFYDRNGRLIGALDAEGYFRRTEYDAAGRKVRELASATATTATLRATGSYAQLAASTGYAALDHDRRYFYDNQGLLRFTADNAGTLIEYRYDSGEGAASPGGPVQTIRYALSTGALPVYTYASVRDAVAQQGLGNLPGNRSSFAVYDRAGRLAYAIDAEGAVVGHGYDAQGLRIRTTAYARRLATASVPSKLYMDQWARTNAAADDRTVRSFYDAAGQERYSIDGEGYVTGSERDADGQVLRTMRWGNRVVADDSSTIAGIAAQLGTPGVTTSYGYDTLGRLVEAVDGEGIRTRSVYGANGLVQSETRAYGTPEAVTTTYAYDGAGRVRSRTLAAGTAAAATTSFEYDGLGNVVAEVDALSRRTVHGYDRAGRRTSTTDALNGTVRFEHDAFGNVVRTVDARGNATYRYYDKLDRLVVERDAEDYVTETSYDLLGDMVAVTRRANRATNAAAVGTLPSVAGDAGDATTRFRYDRLGRVIATTDAEGGVEQRWYDAFGNAVQYQDQRGGISRKAYDRRGLLVGESSAGGANGADASVLQQEASAVDLDLAYYRSTNSDLAGVNDTDLRWHWTNHGWREGRRPNAFFDPAYYLANNADVRAANMDPLQHYEQFGVYEGRRPSADASARPIASDGGTLTRYEYDGLGNMLRRVEAAGQASERSTWYGYDRLGRLVERHSMPVESVDANFAVQPPAPPIERFVYDRRGNVIEQTDPRGARTLRWYDALDRQVAEVDALGTLSTWRYDANGNLTSAKIYGTPIALPADARGAVPGAPGGEVRETLYFHDALNRVEAQEVVGVLSGSGGAGSFATGVGNLRTSFRYDANGNVVQTVDPTGIGTYAVYDRAGRKLRQTDGENYVTEWQYDAESNVVRERRTADRATVDAAGGFAAPAASTDDRVTTFTYDRNGRRTSETRLGVKAYAVGAEGVITELTGTGERDQSVRYAYDARGQVYAKTEATGDVTRYGYDRAGRLRAEIRGGFTDHSGATTEPRVSYFYDALGNLIRTDQWTGSGATATFRTTRHSYDAGGRLKTTTDAEGNVTTRRYNLAGDLMIEEGIRNELNSAGTAVPTTEATLYTRDVLGRVLSEGRAYWTGTEWKRSHKEGNDYDVVRTTYTGFGELKTRSIGGGTGTVPAQEQYRYDNAGRLVATNAGDGVWRYTVHDKAGRQTLTIANLDLADLVGATLDQALAKAKVGNAAIGGTHVAGLYMTFQASDGRGQVTSITEPFAENGSYTAGANDTRSYSRQSRSRSITYNAFGEVASETDYLNNKTEYAYNAMGRLIRLQRPQIDVHRDAKIIGLGTPTDQYFYDRSGRRIGSEDALGRRESRLLLAGTGYGGAEAMVTEQWHADGTSVSMVYDGYGDLRQSVDELGQQTDMTYDRMGRLIEIQRPGGIAEHYRYDERGNRTLHWNAVQTQSQAAVSKYDAQGRVYFARSFGGSEADITVTRRVWNSGSSDPATYPHGYWEETATTFNPALGESDDVVFSKAQVTETDAFGRVLLTRDMGGMFTRNTYDRGGRLTASTIRTERSGGTVKRQTTYTTLNTGLVATVLREDQSGTTLQKALQTDAVYDSNGRKTSEKSWRWEGNPRVQVQFQNATATYNALGWRTGWEEAGGTATAAAKVTHTHDAVGNIRSTERTAKSLVTATTQTTTERFGYDARNRVTLRGGLAVKVSAPDAPEAFNLYAADGSTRITYDALGRQETVQRFRETTRTRQVNQGSGPPPTVHDGGNTTVEQEFDPDPPQYETYNVGLVEREDYRYAASGGVLDVRFTTTEKKYQADSKPHERYTAATDAGGTIARYGYDALGRLTTQVEFRGDGQDVIRQRSVGYDDMGRMSSDTTVLVQYSTSTNAQDRPITRSVTTFAYERGGDYAFGNAMTTTVASYTVPSTANTATTTEITAPGTWSGTTTTENYYDWYGGPVLSSTSVTTTGQSGRSTSHGYDTTGVLESVTISDGRPRTVTYRTDLAGQVVERKEAVTSGSTMPHEVTYRFDGEQQLQVGNDGTSAVSYDESLNRLQRNGWTGPFRDGDYGPSDYRQAGQSPDVLNAYNQGSSGGSYAARGGETLADVARALWGDANLWYLLGQANGLTAGATLFEGQRLTIPAGVTRNANAATSFTPYDPSLAIGEVSASEALNPTSAAPRGRRNKCGALGAVLVAAVAIVAAVHLSPAVAGAIKGLFGAAATATVATASGTALTATAAAIGTFSTIAGGALAGAAGSIVGQGLAVATGLQDRFSWKGVALAAIGGGVGGAGLLGSSSGVLAGIGRGVLGNVLTQGTSLALGLQQRFDFVGLAVAGVAGGVGDLVSDGKTGTWRQIKAGAASAIAGAATRSIATGTSFGDNVLAVLPDVIGTTIGRVVGASVAAAVERRALARAQASAPRLTADVGALLQDSGVTGGGGPPPPLSPNSHAGFHATGNAPGRPALRGTVTVEDPETMPLGSVSEIPPARDLMTWALRRENFEAGKLPGYDYSPWEEAFSENFRNILMNDAKAAGQVAQIDLIFGGAIAAWMAPLVLPAMVEGGLVGTIAGILDMSASLNNVGGIGTAALGKTERPLDLAFGDGASSRLDLAGGVIGLGAGVRLLRQGAGSAVGDNPIISEIDSNLHRYSLEPPVIAGFDATPGTIRAFAAESEAAKLVPRLGPKGVDPLHHNANVLVRDASGNVVAHERFVSGNMTLEEQALGFPRNTLASHTEARAVRSMELEPGGRMTITGQSPPCPSCKGAMNRAASESGATIKYQWRQNGKTVTWTATLWLSAVNVTNVSTR
ncbi:hypothetical protein [Sphingomonas sp. VNH70]|uniref:hypothetical protein n=1 Tax=Sphingomonas silueang TaxID=3156617 RepID=UPI0032B3A819